MAQPLHGTSFPTTQSAPASRNAFNNRENLYVSARVVATLVVKTMTLISFGLAYSFMSSTIVKSGSIPKQPLLL